MKRILILLITAGLLGACRHAEDYRWARAQFWESPEAATALKDAQLEAEMDFEQPHVAIYAYSKPAKSTENSISIKDLQNNGQAEFIKACYLVLAKCSSLRTEIAKPISSNGSGSAPPRSMNRFDITLIATVAKGAAARPGDRLVWTRVLVRPNNFEFTGYTVVATDNKVLNIEHVQTQTTTSVQGQVSATLPVPANVGLSGTGSLSNQYTTSADINQQYENLGVDIRPNFLSILRESERNLDVAGNTLIILSAIINPQMWAAASNSGRTVPRMNPVLLVSSIELSKGNKLVPPSKANLNVASVEIPPYCPLTAQVRMIWDYRRVLRGADTYQEGNQSVRFEENATPWRTVTILPTNEVVPGLWALETSDRTPILLKTTAGDQQRLIFDNYNTARAFANWMVQEKAKWIGSPGVKLTIGGDPFRGKYPELTADRFTPSSAGCNWYRAEGATARYP